MPPCAYALAKSCPGYATWASPADISWCGKTRSEPPPWMSKSLPEVVVRDRGALDVPARPAAARTGCPTRARPGARSSQSRQSSGSRLPGRSGSPPRSAKISSISLAVEPRHLAEARVGRAPRSRGRRRRRRPRPCSCSRSISATTRSIDSTAPRYSSGGMTDKRLHVVAEQLGLALGQLAPVLAAWRWPARAAGRRRR